ncbi:MDR family oxidoreductase [Corynebacterium sp. TAE3-ERU16]|uniref:MDR family oxidoreductase n=1 Tax=Corynebacterium sp. TAE3-ERU16 TaxID=2849493 RepID=UPI001C4670C2|nr:MDR family oxidoreductase [Corynebacterium sp. TAE3-ERU16]MBV7292451.1 oxidoreductase [Corynebacterium sp. TAE3-ERU16]
MTHTIVVDRCTDPDNPDGTVVTSRMITEDDTVYGEGDILIDVTYSSLNYKDALALRGTKGVARTLPLVPGIDACGTVVDSDSDRFAPGDRVVVNGAGLGETRAGGYTGKLRVDSASTVHIPESISTLRSAAIGTAGFTAALSVDALTGAGVSPQDGPILVTGATGGVGTTAILLLASLGFDIVAATGRVAEHSDMLRELGAAEIIDRAELAEPGRPLQSERYAGAVDTAGSHTLVNVLAQVRWGGAVTACGLAHGADLPGTVMPFILRAVKLLGINSVDAPPELRERAWKLLSEHLDQAALDRVTTIRPLSSVAQAGEELLAGKLAGRTVIDLSA